MFEHKFNSRPELDTKLASAISQQLQDAINERGKAWLVVSGGGTPKGLLAQLANSILPWDKVTVLLADDRWVPLEHNNCNEGMLRKVLLNNKAAHANILSLVADYPDQHANLARVKHALVDVPSFDVVILGMGLDGHTASLFPQAPELLEGLETEEDVLMVSPQTAPHRRVSLSRQRISNTRFGVLHIVGKEKLAVLHNAIEANDMLVYPITNFVGNNNSFTVYYAA